MTDHIYCVPEETYERCRAAMVKVAGDLGYSVAILERLLLSPASDAEAKARALVDEYRERTGLDKIEWKDR